MKSIKLIGDAKRKENGEINVPESTFNKYILFYLDVNRYQRYIKSDMAGNLEIILPYSKGYDEHPYWLIKKLEYIKSIIQRYFKDKEGEHGKKKGY